MSGDRLVISAFGFVNESAYGGTLLGGRVKPLPDLPFSELRWNTFSTRPCERYGRLDILSRYGLAAVELLGLSPVKGKPNDTALVMGTQHGCLSVDLDFRESMDQEGGGSPLLFMYTLPNVCLGEIAIRHNLTGPSLCLVNGEQSGLAAIWEGIRLIRCGEVESCICLEADALGKWSGLAGESELSQVAGRQGAAYCFLIESARYVENRLASPLAHIVETKPHTPNGVTMPGCHEQLSKLINYLEEVWSGAGAGLGIELKINLYCQNKILYVSHQ